MKPPFIKEGHQECFDGILTMMTESELVESFLNTDICQNGSAHFGTQGTGVFLPAIIKNDLSDFCFPYKIFDLQLIAKSSYRRKIKWFQPHRNRYCQQGKILMRKLPVKTECMQQKKRIFTAGHTDNNPVSGINQAEILISLSQTAKRFFHRKSPIPLKYVYCRAVCGKERSFYMYE